MKNKNSYLGKRISIRISNEHERMLEQLIKEDITPTILIRYYLDQAVKRMTLITQDNVKQQ